MAVQHLSSAANHGDDEQVRPKRHRLRGTRTNGKGGSRGGRSGLGVQERGGRPMRHEGAATLRGPTTQQQRGGGQLQPKRHTAKKEEGAGPAKPPRRRRESFKGTRTQGKGAKRREAQGHTDKEGEASGQSAAKEQGGSGAHGQRGWEAGPAAGLVSVQDKKQGGHPAKCKRRTGGRWPPVDDVHGDDVLAGDAEGLEEKVDVSGAPEEVRSR